MEQAAVIIAVVVGVLFVILSVFTMLKASSESDDQIRLLTLKKEGEERYPGTEYKNMLEFMRRDRYQKLKLATGNNEEIAELTEDYLVLNDEIERVQQEEEQYGGEFTPHYERRDSLV